VRRSGSDDADVDRLVALAARLHLELDCLVGLERAAATADDVAVVDEEVLSPSREMKP